MINPNPSPIIACGLIKTNHTSFSCRYNIKLSIGSANEFLDSLKTTKRASGVGGDVWRV